MAEIGKHIPVTKVCSIDEVACRLLDNANDIELAMALARRIKGGIRANVGDRLTSAVGIAPNRLLAKLASDMQKPDGLMISANSTSKQVRNHRNSITVLLRCAIVRGACNLCS